MTGAIPASTRGPSVDAASGLTPLRDRQQVAADQQVALPRDLREDREQRLAGEVLEPQVGVARAGVADHAVGRVGVPRSGRPARAAASDPRRSPGSGAAPGVGWAGSIVTVQWQCGVRSAGTRGGRWIGRTAACAGWWRARSRRTSGPRWCGTCRCTHSSPIGSTSMSAPQWSSQNSPCSSSIDLHAEVHELRRRADVELDVLEDRPRRSSRGSRAAPACAPSRSGDAAIHSSIATCSASSRSRPCS